MIPAEDKASPGVDACLVNPPWVTKEDNIWHGIKGAMPPLGLLSIASHQISRGQKVAVLDIPAERLDLAGVRGRLASLRPKVVGLSVLTATSSSAHMIARAAKEILPDSLVVMGGTHASVLPGECLANRAVDVVVIGDGEETFSTLTERIIAGRDFRDLPGIAFRSFRDGVTRVELNPAAPVIMELDRFPPPAYHLVPMHRYRPTIGAYRRLPAVSMLMTRGCPGRCGFCNSARTPLRTRSARLVVEEISALHRDYGIREIQFYDDTFTVNKSNVMEFCRLMRERNPGITWSAFARADCIDKPMIDAMKGAGCHQVMFGLESGDPEILRRIGKPIDLDRSRGAVNMAARAGLDVRAAFVYGMEGETVESMRATLAFALSLEISLAIFNIATPYPGTALFEWAKKNGRLLHENWNEYELGRPVLELPTVSSDKVLEFYRQSYRAFYFRPRTIFSRLRTVSTPAHWLDLARAAAALAFPRASSRKSLSADEWNSRPLSDFQDFDFTAPPASAD